MSDDSIIYEWIDEHEDELMERELDLMDFIEMFGSEERGEVAYAYWESIIPEVEEKGLLDRIVDAIRGGLDKIVGFIRGIFK